MNKGRAWKHARPICFLELGGPRILILNFPGIPNNVAQLAVEKNPATVGLRRQRLDSIHQAAATLWTTATIIKPDQNRDQSSRNKPEWRE